MVGSTTVENLLTPNDLLTPHVQWESEAKSTMGNDAVENLIEDGLTPKRTITPKQAKCTPSSNGLTQSP